MAYAFRQHFQGPARSSRPMGAAQQFHCPHHTSPSHSLSPPFHGASQSNYQMSSGSQPGVEGTSPQRMARNLAYVSRVVKSPTDSSLQSHSHSMHPPINLNASLVASPQVPLFSPTSIRRPTANLDPLQFSPYHRAQQPARGTGMEHGHTYFSQSQGGIQSHQSPSWHHAHMQRTTAAGVTNRHNDQPDTTG